MDQRMFWQNRSSIIKKLYTKTPGNDELCDPELNNILNTEVETLSDDQIERCEIKLILYECECALKVWKTIKVLAPMEFLNGLPINK